MISEFCVDDKLIPCKFCVNDKGFRVNDMFLMTRNCAKFRIFSMVHYDTFFLRKKNVYKPYQKLIQFFYRDESCSINKSQLRFRNSSKTIFIKGTV